MKVIERSIAALAILGVVSCGSGTVSGQQGDLPFAADSAPTTTDESASPSTAEGSAAPTTMPSLVITAEMLSGMLESEQGRALIVQGLADQAGIEPVAAECFVDNISVETMAGLSVLQAPSGELDLEADQLVELQDALLVCDISPDALFDR